MKSQIVCNPNSQTLAVLGLRRERQGLSMRWSYDIVTCSYNHTILLIISLLSSIPQGTHRNYLWILRFCGYSCKLFPQNLGVWCPLHGISEQSAKIVFFTNSWKFSPSKFSRCTVSQYTAYHSIPVYHSIHSIPQYITVFHSVLQYSTVYHSVPQYSTVFHSVLQYSTVYQSIPQYITVYYSMSQYM